MTFSEHTGKKSNRLYQYRRTGTGVSFIIKTVYDCWAVSYLLGPRFTSN
ncbi:MAG: hypothetical protein ACFFD4_04465 [Candidatus Odinarchaeota archaeon]